MTETDSIENHHTLHDFVIYQLLLKGLSVNKFISQEDVDLSNGTISNLRQRKPSAKTYAILAKELNVSIAYLVDLPISHS